MCKHKEEIDHSKCKHRENRPSKKSKRHVCEDVRFGSGEDLGDEEGE